MLSMVLPRLDSGLFKPIVCCLYDLGTIGKELQQKGYTCYSNIQRSHYDWTTPRRLSRILTSERINILYHVNADNNGLMWGYLATLLHPVNGIITALHNNYYRFKWPTIMMPLRRQLFGTSSIVVALNQEHCRYIEEEYRVPQNKMRIIHNGVDLNKFSDISPPQNPNIGMGRKKIVAIIASLRPEKAHAVFLDTACIVRKERQDVEFWIAGEGPERSGIERKIRSMQAGSFIKMQGYQADIPKLLQQVDIVCMTSDLEVAPISIIEAMAAGRPVVATDVGLVKEIVSNNESGFIVPPREPRLLAEKVLYLLSRYDCLEKMGTAGRERVRELFGIEKTVDKLERTILELASPLKTTYR